MNETTLWLLQSADNRHRLRSLGLVTINKLQVRTAHMHNTVSDKLTCIIKIKYLSTILFFLLSLIMNAIVLPVYQVTKAK